MSLQADNVTWHVLHIRFEGPDKTITSLESEGFV